MEDNQKKEESKITSYQDIVNKAYAEEYNKFYSGNYTPDEIDEHSLAYQDAMAVKKMEKEMELEGHQKIVDEQGNVHYIAGDSLNLDDLESGNDYYAPPSRLFDEMPELRHLAEGDKMSEEEANKIEKELGEQYGIDLEKYKSQTPKPFIMKNFFVPSSISAQNYEYQGDLPVNLYNTKTGEYETRNLKGKNSDDDFVIGIPYNSNMKELKDFAMKLYLSSDDNKVVTDIKNKFGIDKDSPITLVKNLSKFNNEELSEIIKLEASLGEFKTLINNGKNKEAEAKMGEIKSMIAGYASKKDESNETQGKTWILETIAPVCDIFSNVYNYNYPLSASMDFYEKYNNASAKTEKDVDNIIERMANGEDVLGEGDNQIQDTNNKQMGYTVAGLLGFIAGVVSIGIIILGVLVK